MANLITGGLGTGILCLPWLTAGASLIPGMFIIIAVLVVNVWTIDILIEAADKHQVFDLGNLLAQLPGALGATMPHLANATVWLSTMICLVSYIIVIATAFVTLLGDDRWRTPLVILGTAAVGPLCFVDQSKLAFSSKLTVVVFVYMFFILVGKLSANGVHSTACYFGVGFGSIAMLGGMANCVIVQMCVLPMYGELKDRTPAKMMNAVKLSFSGLFVLFGSFSVSGYLWRGELLTDNIVCEIGKESFLDKLAQLGSAVAVIGVYPILVSPMLAPVRASPTLQSFDQHITMAIVATSGLIAIFVNELGKLSVINGAICAGVFGAGLPAMVGHYILQKDQTQMGILLVCGLLVAGLGIMYTDNYWEDMKCWIPSKSNVPVPSPLQG